MFLRAVSLRAVVALLACWIALPATVPAQTPVKSVRLRNESIKTTPAPARAVGPAQAPAQGQGQGQGTAPAQRRPLSGLYLIQTEERLDGAAREQLRALGVQILRYVPDDAWVVRVDGVSSEAIEALPFVRWVGAYRPEHKVLRALEERARRGGAEPIAVKVLLAPGAPAGEVAQARRLLERAEGESSGRFGAVLRGRLAPGQLRALAASPAVLWVEPAPNFRLRDEIASKIIAGDGGPGQLFTQGLGYDGRGVTVAVADSGLDSGDPDLMHPDLAGRVTGLFFYGNLTDASDEHSHGTHVAGIVGGNGATGETDELGALYGLGVAPGVNIVAQRLFDAAGGFEAPPSFETMTRDAVRAGADIGSNSWGDDTQGRYDISAMEFDALVRDADGLAFGDQPYILEFSAGNAGPGIQTVGSPAVAKNVIATGASVNNRFNLPLEEFTIYDTGQETMADFSSRGPCEDGRIKPDLVAPGTWIASLRSVFANDDFAWWPISDNYLYQGGTSQAGPAASGAAAVLVQYWRDTHTNQTPSPALVKALLINTAVDMDDAIETGPVPNNDEGWGRVDLTGLIGTGRKFQTVDQTIRLAGGAVSERRVLVDSPEEPLRITLVYTDVPGFPGAVPALVNDLDLEVVAPDGAVYRGNQFEEGESVPNAPLGDALNNVEAVYLAVPAPGEYVVRVRARNVAADARIDTAEIDQDFALVIAGGLARPGTGIVAFDRRAYSAPATLRLTLFEQDLTGFSTASLRLRSGQEPAGEIITLRAAGSSGVFTAAVATATGPALADGRLQVRHNDFIEAIYEDASPVATRQFFARADLQAPVISGVSTRFEFGRQFVSWNTDEEASGIVRFGTNTLSRSITNSFLDVGHELQLTNLAAGVPYRFEIVATDEAGNRATNNNGGAYFTFTPQVVPSVLVVDAYFNDLFDIPPISGYTAPLTQLGVVHDVWDVELNGPVNAALLAPYRAVLWRVAEFSLGATFSASDAAAANAYLAGGGSLFMGSMELLSRLDEAGLTAFARDTLGVQSYTADTGAPSISGVVGEPIGNGLATSLDYTPYEDFVKELVGITADASDQIAPGTNSSPVFLSGGGPVGVRLPRTGQDRPGRVVFLSFPLDAVPLGSGIGNNRAGLLRNILNFLIPTAGSGTLALDREAYTVPGAMIVEVDDVLRSGAGSIPIRAFSPRQAGGVAFTLAETPRRGLFRGQIPLEPPGQPGGAPALVTANGETVRIEYTNALSGQRLEALAAIETSAPVIALVDSFPAYTEAIITWQTSEAADSLVQFSDAPGTFPINFTAYDPTFTVDHEVVIGRLEPDTVYYFRVASRDPAGNAATNATIYSFRTLRPAYAPWTDSFEHGPGDWTVVSLEESELTWELGVPQNGADAASPVNAWGTSLQGARAALAESVLISPGIYLSGGSRIFLQFAQNYDFVPSDNSDAFEFGSVEIYTNLNTAAVPLATVSDSSGSDWETMTIDLTAYRGQVVYLAWHYVLFDFADGDRFGWLIDDVSIVATNNPSGTVSVSNNLWQARFVMTGPSGRPGQGTRLELTNAIAGTYTVTYGDVPYYQTPPPQTNALAPSGRIAFEGRYVMADVNANGMSDAWEQDAFGTVSPTRTRQSDTDGDGFTDYAEFVAGTNPNQPTSSLRLAGPVPLLNGAIRLQWPVVPGRAYRLEAGAIGAAWVPVTDWLVAGSSPSMSFAVPASSTPGLTYFRVVVQP